MNVCKKTTESSPLFLSGARVNKTNIINYFLSQSLAKDSVWVSSSETNRIRLECRLFNISEARSSHISGYLRDKNQYKKLTPLRTHQTAKFRSANFSNHFSCQKNYTEPCVPNDLQGRCRCRQLLTTFSENCKTVSFLNLLWNFTEWNKLSIPIFFQLR